MGGATPRPSPTPPPGSCSGWRPATAPTPERRTASAAPKHRTAPATLPRVRDQPGLLHRRGHRHRPHAWLQLLALRGDLGTAEPKRLRYRILHTAARLVHGQRRRRLRIPTIWPWAQQITTAYTRIMTIPRTRLTSTTVNRDKRRTPVGTRRSGWPVASGRTSPTAGARHTR
jgi:hypothetical protein